MSLPNLLFVTPTLPTSTGTGSNLRAAIVLEALTKRFRVHVLNLNLWAPSFGRTSFVQNLAASYVEIPRGKNDLDSARLMEDYFPGISFAAIHTFKLGVARVTIGMLVRVQPHPYLVLDLDDDECARNSGILTLVDETMDPHTLTRVRAEQAQLRMLEKLLVPRFHSICLAGLDDCKVLAERYPKIAVHHLPNAINLPQNTAKGAAHDAVVNLLFVGALNYAPNADGIVYFCKEVLPLIQKSVGIPVALRIVGSDPSPRVSNLARNSSVTIHANVPSVESFYRAADVCIVPLRAGSGTRIKILEAFSFRRPVVSTKLGAEGLAVTDGIQLRIEDEPEAMASACLTMIQDEVARHRMVGTAYEWVCTNHSAASVEAAVDSIYTPVLAS